MPTAEQLDELRTKIADAEDSLKNLENELRLAERAGIDVAEKRTRYTELRDKIRRVKSVYGV